MKRSGIILALSLRCRGIERGQSWQRSVAAECLQGWGRATPQLSYFLQQQVPRRLLMAGKAHCMPHAIVPALWMEPETAKSSVIPDHCSWGAVGHPQKRGQASLALCSFTAHLRSESSLKADGGLSVPSSLSVLLRRRDQQSALLPASPGVFGRQERIQQSAKGTCVMRKHVEKHRDLKETAEVTIRGVQSWSSWSSTITGSHHPFLWRQVFFSRLWWL